MEKINEYGRETEGAKDGQPRHIIGPSGVAYFPARHTCMDRVYN
jgi:hypothetical protein